MIDISRSQIYFPREPEMAQMPIFDRSLGWVGGGRDPPNFVGIWGKAPHVDLELCTAKIDHRLTPQSTSTLHSLKLRRPLILIKYCSEW